MKRKNEVDKKRRIIVEKEGKKLKFFVWTKEDGQQYLFTDPYRVALHNYFRNGRSEREIYEYRNWKKNPRIDKTISKIPMHISALGKEEKEVEKEYKKIQLYIPSLDGFSLRCDA